MLLDSEKLKRLERSSEDTWQYSLNRISSGMDGVRAMCAEASSSFANVCVECTGKEKSPWDDVVEALGELERLVAEKYPGI